MLAEQHREAISGGGLSRFKHWQSGLGGLQAGAAALHVQLRAAARLVAHRSQAHGLLLIGEIIVRDLNLLLGAAQRKIVPRNLGSNRYSHVLQVLLFGGKVAARRLDRAAQVTEEVQFPRSVEPRGVTLGVVALITESRLLFLGM